MYDIKNTTIIKEFTSLEVKNTSYSVQKKNVICNNDNKKYKIMTK